MSPKEEYERRLAARTAEGVALRQRDDRIVTGRAALLLAGLGLAWASIGHGWTSPWWLLLPLGAFAGLVRAHDRVTAARRRAERAARWYARALARLDDRWVG